MAPGSGRMPHSYGASFAADGRRGASSSGHAEAEHAEDHAEQGEHDDRQVLTHHVCPVGTSSALRLAASTRSRRCSSQQPARKMRPDPSGEHRCRLPPSAEVADHVDVLPLARVVDRRAAAGRDRPRCGSVRAGPPRPPRSAACGRRRRGRSPRSSGSARRRCRRPATAWYSPAANVPVSSRNSPAAAAACPNAGASSLSNSHPSAANSAATISASSVKRRVLGHLDALLEHLGLVQRVGVLEHGASRHLGPRRVGAFEADAVDHPDDPQQGHPSGQAGEGDEEAEAGAEVGGEEQVDAAAEQGDGDDEDQESRGAPAPS